MSLADIEAEFSLSLADLQSLVTNIQVRLFNE